MTRPVLRLVLGEGKHIDTNAMDWPAAKAAGFHIHLHIGTPEPQHARSAEMPPPAASVIHGQSGKGLVRPIMLGAAGVLIVLVAFDVGARSGEGHARALASSQTGTAAFAALSAAIPSALPPSAAPTEMPAALRQQLAQPPTITAPPGLAVPAGARDPFGLQH